MDPFEGTCMKIHLYWASTFFKLPLFSIADGACSTMVWLQVCGSYHMYTCMSLLKCETKERSIINANISMYKPGLYKGTSKAQGCKYDFFFCSSEQFVLPVIQQNAYLCQTLCADW